MVAEVPMNGIIFPPFWVFTSLRYVPAEPRASVRMTSGFDFSKAATSVRYEEAPSLIGWLMAIFPPSLVNAFVAGSTKAWEPMSSPNTSAAFLYGAWLGPKRALPTIANASYTSAGTRRWKYLSVVLLNSDCPVMQNIGRCALSMIGATAAASSEVHPTAAIKLELLAIIWFAAGTASAGSPRVSNCWHFTWRPPTPPLLLISGAAARQAA